MTKLAKLVGLSVAIVALGAANPNPIQAAAPAPVKDRAEHPTLSPRPAHRLVSATDQLPSGTRSAASTAAAAAPFLTRPYWGPHSVNSVFDHCNPDYSLDGQICEVDGTVATRSNGVDPTFAAGYAVTPGGTDYLYYDGHNGWDLGLNYETLLAAAPGTVNIAGSDPYNSGFGLTVTIDHGNGFTTRYAHMSQVWVTSGQPVARGQAIGVSGNTGASTGPHLHFGVYLTQPWIAIDPWGWTGAAADPWPYDAGNLWLTGNPHDPVPDAPTGVSATISGTSAIVSWSPPAFDGGSPITGYTIRASNGGPAFTIPGGNRTAGVDGLTPGVSYTFTVAAQNAVGGGPASQPTNPVTATAITYTGWFPWYDNASPGMLADNVHLVNPGATPVTGSMSIPGGPAVPVSLAPGAEAYFGFPAGTVGGPVQLALTGQVIASQRVQYFQSFNEVLARQASQASTSLWFGWYDNASPGMHADNVHLVNPSSSTASGTISLPGAASIAFSLAPGASGYYAFPAGTIGGPLHVSASQPVLASQRVQYFQSFDEVPAAAGSAAATNQYLDWYDFASPGMDNDNLHLVNPGSTSATGSISLPGAAPIQFSVPAGGAAHYAFPRGTIGGPVTITSSQPLLASQRVQYFQSFDEVPARSAADASSRLYLNWYDRASPGMDNVNVHLVDVGASPVTGSVGMPGAASLSFALQPGQEAHLAFPPGTIGGPVTVSASGPVIASERVQYYQSFDEVPGAPAT